MKSAVLTLTSLAAAYAAKDVAPPVISLSMAERSPFLMKIDTIHRTVGGLADSGAEGSSQDYTMMCPAGASTSTTCPLPRAKSYDHHDGTIPVEVRVFKMTNAATYFSNDAGFYDDGCGDDPKELRCPTAKAAAGAYGDIYQHDENCIEYSHKGTYLIKYDSKDRAGNQAHQLVFGLVLDDKMKPVIDLCQDTPRTIEAGSYDDVCLTTTISDNMVNSDADQALLDATLKFHITHTAHGSGASQVWKGCDDVTGCTQAQMGAAIDTTVQGDFLIKVTGNDQACIYGENGDDNAAIERSFTVSVYDTRAPLIKVLGSDPYLHECNYHLSATPKYDEGSYVGNDGDSTDEGASVTDTYDDIDSADHAKADITITAQWNDAGVPAGGSQFNTNIATGTDTHTMNYNAADATGNEALQQTRVVSVVDTLKPEITLTAPEPEFNCGNSDASTDCVIFHAPADAPSSSQPTEPFNDVTSKDYSCLDFCQGDIAKGTRTTAPTSALTIAWKDGVTWDDKKLGDYVRIYTCTDHAGNTDQKSRTFRVEDHSKPTLTENADPNGNLYEANRDDVYTDAGAQCSDYVDGQINEKVKVSGHVVNLRVPGVYKIKYDCADKSNNQADQITRTVTVVDQRKPRCEIVGPQTIELEAGFDYVDQGAKCTDDLDGEINMCAGHEGEGAASDSGKRGVTDTDVCITTYGDTVDKSRSYLSASSCEQIAQYMADASVSTTGACGDYFVTTKVAGGSEHDKTQFSRTQVQCFFQHPTYKTWKLIKGGVASARGTGASCADYNMHPVEVPASGNSCDGYTFDGDDAATYTSEVCWDAGADTSVVTTDYLCVMKDPKPNERQMFGATMTHATLLSNDHATTQQAEIGKYVIHYTAKDFAALESDKVYRTVLVRDTLPPVISLHNAQTDALLDSGAGQQYSKINPSKSNPALDSYDAGAGTGNPNLMAESAQTSVNGWIIGAVASGVTGLALVAYASKI